MDLRVGIEVHVELRSGLAEDLLAGIARDSLDLPVPEADAPLHIQAVEHDGQAVQEGVEPFLLRARRLLGQAPPADLVPQCLIGPGQLLNEPRRSSSGKGPFIVVAASALRAGDPGIPCSESIVGRPLPESHG